MEIHMIKGECENCGANIDIENERECSYCGTKYSEKIEPEKQVIINNYYTVENDNGYERRIDINYQPHRRGKISVGLTIFLFLFFPPLGVIYLVLSILRSAKKQ